MRDTTVVTEDLAGVPAVDVANVANVAAFAAADEHLVEEDLLVEDVSIDGMCGVY